MAAKEVTSNHPLMRAHLPSPKIDLGKREANAPGERTGAGIVAYKGARRRDRRDRHVDAGLIHEGQPQTGVPRWRSNPAHRILEVVGPAEEKVREDVVMVVAGERHGRPCSL